MYLLYQVGAAEEGLEGHDRDVEQEGGADRRGARWPSPTDLSQAKIWTLALNRSELENSNTAFMFLCISHHLSSHDLRPSSSSVSLHLLLIVISRQASYFFPKRILPGFTLVYRNVFPEFSEQRSLHLLNYKYIPEVLDHALSNIPHPHIPAPFPSSQIRTPLQ